MAKLPASLNPGFGLTNSNFTAFSLIFKKVQNLFSKNFARAIHVNYIPLKIPYFYHGIIARGDQKSKLEPIGACLKTDLN